MRISIFRTAHFNAAHRLHVHHWSEEKNKATFGVCNNPNYHGHNYELEIKVTGELDDETGMLIDLNILKEMIEINVLEKFDHKNLNLDLPEFKNMNPTAENICYVIWNIMRGLLDPQFDLHVRLYETARNYVEYPA